MFENRMLWETIWTQIYQMVCMVSFYMRNGFQVFHFKIKRRKKNEKFNLLNKMNMEKFGVRIFG